jgi:hypothetical protein
MGQEERFPSTRLSAGYGFRKETIAGVRHKERDAPSASNRADDRVPGAGVFQMPERVGMPVNSYRLRKSSLPPGNRGANVKARARRVHCSSTELSLNRRQHENFGARAGRRGKEMAGGRVKFGLTLPNRGVVIGATTAGEMLQLAADAESSGWDSVWVWRLNFRQTPA